jgi:valacyclovir hydrolase
MPSFQADGHTLHYREEGDGPLLLILPGNTATSACHQGELGYFGQRYHAVSLDFWGTGQSERVSRWPDDWFQQAARDAVALIENLNEDRAIVMGTSGGAAVALWMSVLYPQRVEKVVADSEVTVYPPELLLAQIRDREQRTSGQVGFWRFAQGQDWEQVVSADSQMLCDLARRGGRLLPDDLHDVACPVLLTALLEDELLPDVGKQLPALAQQIPDSRLLLLHGSGHPLMWSHPNQFRAVCDLFLQGKL